nr:MAG TPA: hypothetical protein [Caudoviricetes sp.]
MISWEPCFCKRESWERSLPLVLEVFRKEKRDAPPSA